MRTQTPNATSGTSPLHVTSRTRAMLSSRAPKHTHAILARFMTRWNYLESTGFGFTSASATTSSATNAVSTNTASTQEKTTIT
ncbi:hypothetical protein DPMN_136937 [Dreissena polymorpha]|uniref:Uncharacterized protein n=1 Tax=Dreissena polymorpha TaxID=45954 RepID=A0A9D4JE97_DREPO|nr:hypothetical protein DPMN_136937 [Dreissena polymorpha]